MGNKWVKVLIGVVLSVAIFGGVAAFVFDMNPLGGSGPAHAEQEVCLERAVAESDREACYDAYFRESDRNFATERWVAAGAGLAAVGLFWVLVNAFYLRPRRRRRDETNRPG